MVMMRDTRNNAKSSTAPIRAIEAHVALVVEVWGLTRYLSFFKIQFLFLHQICLITVRDPNNEVQNLFSSENYIDIWLSSLLASFLISGNDQLVQTF